MNNLTHKGYSATIEFSPDDDAFIGRILGINDIITFEGESVQELKNNFYEAVDFYIDTCAQKGVEPNKPYSGNLMLRIPKDIHAKIAMLAEAKHTSINQLASELFQQAVM